MVVYNPATVAALVAIPVISLIGIGITICHYTRNKNVMRKYELEFFEKYGNKNEIAKLTLDHNDTDLLHHICKHKVEPEMLNKKSPGKEEVNIALKRIKKKVPIRAEAIRCDDTFAMIGAFKERCIIVMLKTTPFKDHNGDTFTFFEEFCYEPMEKKSVASGEQLVDSDGSASESDKSTDREERNEVMHEKLEEIREELKEARENSGEIREEKPHVVHEEPGIIHKIHEMIEERKSEHSSSSSEEDDEKKRLKDKKDGAEE